MISKQTQLNDIIVTFDGKVIGNLDSISATAEIDTSSAQDETRFVAFGVGGFSGAFDVSYISPELEEMLEYQKALIRNELEHARQMPPEPKEPKMRQDINNFLKRGKKW